jgi:hypothetical protein
MFGTKRELKTRKRKLCTELTFGTIVYSERVREGVMDAKYFTVEETRNVFRILIEKCGVEPTFSTSAQTRE